MFLYNVVLVNLIYAMVLFGTVLFGYVLIPIGATVSLTCIKAGVGIFIVSLKSFTILICGVLRFEQASI